MVDLKISSKSIGEELQYLRDGVLKQLVWMVELKSGGGVKFFRSSITDGESVI